MQSLAVKLFRVTVTFNPTNLADPIILLCDDFKVDTPLNNRQLPIPQGISLIILDLITLPGFAGDPARFADDSITWLSLDFDQLPPPPPPPLPPPWSIPQPEVFLVQSFQPNHVTIVDFNTVKEQNSHPFNVNLIFNEVLYSSDPTIINEPPMPTG